MRQKKKKMLNELHCWDWTAPAEIKMKLQQSRMTVRVPVGCHPRHLLKAFSPLLRKLQENCMSLHWDFFKVVREQICVSPCQPTQEPERGSLQEAVTLWGGQISSWYLDTSVSQPSIQQAIFHCELEVIPQHFCLEQMTNLPSIWKYCVLFHFENSLMQTSFNSISINLYIARDLCSFQCSV